MSMTSADILHSCITEKLDEIQINDDQREHLYKLVGNLYDIAEGNICNHRESDDCNCPNKPKGK